MPGKSHVYSSAVLNVLNGNNLPGVTPFVALFSVAPGDDGSAGTELTGSRYSRQAITFGAPGPSPGGRKDVRLPHGVDVWSDTLFPMGPRKFWYSWDTMSALNGDKARFNRERRAKLARRERSQAIRLKLKDRTPPRATGTQL